MILRFQIWRVRRRARLFSRYSSTTFVARVYGIEVGKFRNGKERRV